MINVSCYKCKKQFLVYLKRLRNSKSGLLFCGRKCKQDCQRIDGGIKQIMPSHYGSSNSVSSYRKRALHYYGAKCVSCGYDEVQKMLDVDHIDQSRLNNKIQNLQVLCVWCHAIKTRRDW